MMTMLAAIAMFALTACERSDLISDAGDTIIDDLDSLTNPNRGMIARTFDFILPEYRGLITGRSLPAEADPAFSTHVGIGHLLVGVGADGDTAIGHVQFSVRSFLAEDSTRTPRYERPGDTLESAFILFDTTSTAGTVNVFFSDTLGLGADVVVGEDTQFRTNPDPVNRADLWSWNNCEDLERRTARALDDDNGDNGNGDNGITPLSPCVVEIGNIADNLKRLPDSVAQAIFDKRLESAQDNVPLNIALTITNADGEDALLRLHDLRIIVNVRRVATDSLIHDTIHIEQWRFTVFERADLVAERANLPYSSQLTKRTAVFEIDADPIAAIPNRGELINAVLAIVANTDGTVGDDAGADIVSRNHDRFRAFAHHLEFTEEFASAGVSDSLALRSYLNFANPPPVTVPFNLLPVKQSLMQTFVNNRNQTGNKIYVYLRPSTENSTILWATPRKIDVVFTRAREN